ncbi:tumor necrosis factor receptor superfamily member 27 [Protopterus annectens]|uniref:tumor necrosis factor receptor superfamily member 27 n=1 Tax=Protopterus annectens TaxID=7888 RepID=UPI001CFAC23F|nr:tumor necrosis factor receptor superfamily member 27 [Protopterus annectens]
MSYAFVVPIVIFWALSQFISPASTLKCQENEYLDWHGKCVSCKECGPGYEPSQECGYGEGDAAYCINCGPRRYKENWGHHRCKLCLSCALINRVQLYNCTASSNSVCGQCLPGFYSKTRIGGQQDWECIPCSQQTVVTEIQCHSKVESIKSEASWSVMGDVVLAVVISSAIATCIVALCTFAFILRKHMCSCKTRNEFIQSSGPSDESSTSSDVIQQPASHCLQRAYLKNLPEGGTDSGSLGQGCSHKYEIEPPVLFPLDTPAKSLLMRSLSETCPLLRYSGCSEVSTMDPLVKPPITRHSPMNFPESSVSEQKTQGAISISELESRCPHAPVECTELDLQECIQDRGLPERKPEEDSESPRIHQHPRLMTKTQFLAETFCQLPAGTFCNHSCHEKKRLNEVYTGTITNCNALTSQELLSPSNHTTICEP